ncbi:hypothetical protein DPQ33_01080 [Oceanidesulfovibrio indonesiensis]|uniref:DUF58 domain-containing protein n=1 Tax=Oceanidesulfovibrio indonesiensis TaxID=54767 RepID=A0A7M3MK95_9BACT|nr:DUF58 domain-containing protein [Oceanidesulfovibrio indonesiensis]TVM19856.1 hypothetical protein DPQ33_01080 [Oceanidesulfovibrio indonesiensis]
MKLFRGVRPTMRAVAALLALAIAAGAGFLAPWLDLAVLAGIALVAVLIMLDARLARSRVESVFAALESPVVAGRGRVFPVCLVLTNEGGGLVSGAVRVEAPREFSLYRDGQAVRAGLWTGKFAIPAGEQRRMGETAIAPERGKIVLGPVWLQVGGPLGFAERRRTVEATAEVRVFPETLADREGFLDMRGLLAAPEAKTPTRWRGEGLEFESISPYVRGGEERHIDWRATARTGKLMVRRYQLELNREVFVVLDAGRLMGADAGDGTKMDRAVDAGLVLCRTAIDHGDKCGVAVYDSEVRGFLPPQVGPAGFRAIVENVYDTQCLFRESDFASVFAQFQARQRKRALVVVLSDIVDEAGSRSLREALHRLAKRHLVVFAALRTPLIESAFRKTTDSYRELSRQAVAGRLLRDRERGLHMLRRLGVHVLDVEPSQLTVDLVNRYVQLRESGRL